MRVSNELGRGNAKAANFAIKVVLCTSACLGVVFWVLALVFGRKLSYIFTDNEEVADMVSDLSVLLSFTLLLNSIQPVLSGKYIINYQAHISISSLGFLILELLQE